MAAGKNNKIDLEAVAKKARAAVDLVELIGQSITLKSEGSEFYACCPFHNEKTPSFSVNPEKQFFYCFGCGETGDAIDWLKKYNGMNFREAVCSLDPALASEFDDGQESQAPAPTSKPKREIIKVYDYVDGSGVLIFQCCRWNPKSFTYRRPTDDAWINGIQAGEYYRYGNGDWYKVNKKKPPKPNAEFREFPELAELVPYRLPDLLKLADGKGVCLVEGEKDADNLSALGVTTTTLKGGAGKWRPEYAQYFDGRRVFIFPDFDKAGVEGALKTANKLHGVASEIRIVTLPGETEGDDVTDWIERGGDRVKLAEIIQATPVWTKPDSSPAKQATGESTREIEPEQLKALQRHGWIDWPDIKSNGNPLSTIENLAILLDVYEIKIRYNAVRKEMEINIPGESYTTDNALNCALAHINSLATRHHMTTEKIPEYLGFIADENRYNPVADWITSRPWDGENRLPALIQSLDAKSPEIARFLVWRWLVSTVAAAFEPNGVSAGGVLVLQGKQYLGKTAWFWALLNGRRDLGKEGAILNPTDRDSVMQAIQYWLVELGELDATFRKSDIAALKSFITKDTDELRRPYARANSKYPRRTIFFASVNPRQYLHDDTGNRRFWTIECGDGLNPRHGLDTQQIFAQVYEYYKKGEQWLLTREEIGKLNEENEEFEAIDPFEELVHKFYDFGTTAREPISATEVLLAIGYDRPTKPQVNNMATVLRKVTGDEPRKKGGKRVFDMPQKKTAHDGGMF